MSLTIASIITNDPKNTIMYLIKQIHTTDSTVYRPVFPEYLELSNKSVLNFAQVC